jgi:hypothetical protein
MNCSRFLERLPFFRRDKDRIIVEAGWVGTARQQFLPGDILRIEALRDLSGLWLSLKMRDGTVLRVNEDDPAFERLEEWFAAQFPAIPTGWRQGTLSTTQVLHESVSRSFP